MRSPAVAAVLTLLLSNGALAQATGLPSFNAPYRAFNVGERGVAVSFPNGTDAAFEGVYGLGRGVWDVRFRGGVALDQGGNNDAVALLGAEFRTRVITHSEDMPADGALILGAGAQISSNATDFLLPVGLSLGRRLDVDDSEVSIVPYVQPTLIAVVGDSQENFRFSMGLGGDFRLTPVFDLRLSVGFGDHEGFSISAVWVR